MCFSQPNFWDTLITYHMLTWRLDSSHYLQSDSVIIDGVLLPNVGVRLKGKSAYNVPNNKNHLNLI